MPNALLFLGAGTACLANQLQALAAFRPRHLVVYIAGEDARRTSQQELDALGAAAAEVVLTPFAARGEACAALLASEWIDNDDELLVLCEDAVEADLVAIADQFRRRNLAAGLSTREISGGPLPRVRLGGDGLVVEASDSRRIDGSTAAGVYWFRQGAEFLRAAEIAIRKNPNHSGDFGVCPTINEMVLANRAVGVYPVEELA